METILFDGLTPQKYIWVSPTGSDSNSGSEASPLKTIQAAVNKATAGTAIMVTAGVYKENVKLPANVVRDARQTDLADFGRRASGRKDHDWRPEPVCHLRLRNRQLRRAGLRDRRRLPRGPIRRRVVNNLVENILVIDNVIHGTSEVGIKISQANNVQVIGNTVYNVGTEGIDFVAVVDAVVAYNEVSNARSTAAGIVAKSGSTNIAIHHNYVHDIPNGDGISIGGQGATSAALRPGYMDWQAKNVVVSDNYVERVEQNPVIVKGGIDSKIINNYLSADPSYFSNIVVTSGFHDQPDGSRRVFYSANVEIADNILKGKQNIQVLEGSKHNISIHDNAPAGTMDYTSGPGCVCREH